MKPILFIFLTCLMSACSDKPAQNVHEQLRQHILEAELGSAVSIYFAKEPVIPLPPQESESELLSNLKSANPETRWAAADKLAYSNNKEIVAVLVNAMMDSSGTLRVCVMAQALGHLKDPRALSALTEAAFDPYNRDLRLCAIRSIGMIGDKSAVPALIKALKENNTPIQTANTLARLGDERAVQPLIDAASNKNIQDWMIRALGELGNKKALPFLNVLLDDTNSDAKKIIEEARWKISILSNPDQVEALGEILLKSTSSHQRKWAAYRLGEIRKNNIIPFLIDALNDLDAGVKGRAAAALVRTGKTTLPLIRTALSKSQKISPYLIAIMGYIGDETDIEHLKAITNQDAEITLTIDESIKLIQYTKRLAERT